MMLFLLILFWILLFLFFFLSVLFSRSRIRGRSRSIQVYRCPPKISPLLFDLFEEIGVRHCCHGDKHKIGHRINVQGTHLCVRIPAQHEK